MNDISRRYFLKTMGIATAATAGISACKEDGKQNGESIREGGRMNFNLGAGSWGESASINDCDMRKNPYLCSGFTLMTNNNAIWKK